MHQPKAPLEGSCHANGMTERWMPTTAPTRKPPGGAAEKECAHKPPVCTLAAASVHKLLWRGVAWRGALFVWIFAGNDTRCGRTCPHHETTQHKLPLLRMASCCFLLPFRLFLPHINARFRPLLAFRRRSTRRLRFFSSKFTQFSCFLFAEVV